MKATHEQLLAAIAECDGIQTQVARKLGITKQAVSKRIAGNSELQLAVLEAEAALLDDAQNQLSKAIRAGQPWAVKFILSTKGKKLGYTTGSELVVDGQLGVGKVSVLRLPDNGRDG